MADSRRWMDWYDKARKDLMSARILFEHSGDRAIVAFHCQQAIEKAFKGYILKTRNILVDGHSLVYLCRKAEKREFLKDCAFVNQFYIEARYPSDIPIEIEDEEALDCIETAEKVLNSIEV